MINTIREATYNATIEAENNAIGVNPIEFEVETNGVNLFAQLGKSIGVSWGWKRIGFLR